MRSCYQIFALTECPNNTVLSLMVVPDGKFSFREHDGTFSFDHVKVDIIMRVAFGADDHNECTESVADCLHGVAHVKVFDKGSWPEFAKALGPAVAPGEVEYGVLMCWTGTGTSIAANNVPGVRAALAWEPWIARNARLWNDANVLALSLKRLAPDVAVECVKAFLEVEAEDPEESAKIDLIRDL